MSEFFDYLVIGINHILDINGLDHFFFILSFALLHSVNQWKRLLGLVTAFTVGHTITLIISGLNLFTLPPRLIETLIPISILISCLYNFYIIFFKKNKKQNMIFIYIILLFFGLIHGMGFSNYLNAILFDGDPILMLLLGLNIGIEVAQVVIVIVFVLFKEVLYKVLPQYWVHLVLNIVVSFFVVRMFL